MSRSERTLLATRFHSASARPLGESAPPKRVANPLEQACSYTMNFVNKLAEDSQLCETDGHHAFSAPRYRRFGLSIA